ncbi:MAG: 50S ribosomal protein L13 [Nitrososphaeria archaeon]|nr:50S ribosomal protein L13 [Nitrososphaeria archaeon]
MAESQPQSVVVDGTNLLAGRLSSNVAKLLLQGNRVTIINCEKILISGRRGNIIQNYKDFLGISSILHPEHGPYHPRRPDTIIARMIRGMLPRTKPSGAAALRRLRTYVGVPSGFGASKKTSFDNAKITRPIANYTSMSELAKEVGWN